MTPPSHSERTTDTTDPAEPGPKRPARGAGGRRSATWLAGVVAVFAVFGAWRGLAANEPVEAIDAADALPVEIVTAAWQPSFALRERIAGRVVSRRRSELGFDRGGRLASILVDEGDRVPAGALLAQLDVRELEAALREQRARRDATSARLDLARATAARRRNLEARGALSAQALDEAETEETRLVAQLDADQAAIERTRVSIALSRLEAPYPAIVVARHQDEGSVATLGAPLLSVIEDGPREVKLGVPPTVAASLEVGRVYPVERGPGRPIEASLRHVLPEIDRVTRTRTAVFTIEAGEDDPIALADGALVWVRLSRDVPGDGVWLPVGALAEGRRGTWTVYAVEADATGQDRVERRVVEVVHAEGDRAFVRGTLEEGDRIVADGLHRLIPDLPVRVVSARRGATEATR